jgi:N-acetylneuraminate synthase
MTATSSIAFEIGGRPIGLGAPPFVVAEMSGNHNQSLERALQIVDAAADAGAHAIKIQTYTADTMTLDVDRDEFVVEGAGLNLWKGRTLYDLYGEASTPWPWHEPIFARCRARGIVGFSSPFDASAVDFLERLSVPCYKIASFELTDLPLIRSVAATGKPLIMSMGMGTLAEIAEAVTVARDSGCTQLALLKCTSQYPAAASDTHARTIPHLRELFDCEVGLSDHTMGIGVPLAAVALGATIIEKHFTLDRADGGVDSAFSMQPEELAALVTEARRAWEALGTISVGPTPAENAARQYRRSLYIAEDLRAGDTLTMANLRVVRPGLGLHPRYYEAVLGARVNRDVRKGTPLKWSLILQRDS